MNFIRKNSTKKFMRKAKNYIVKATLAFAIIYLIYAISFSTELWQLTKDSQLDWFNSKVQKFNAGIYNASFILIAAVVVMLFFRTEKRRRMYLTNIAFSLFTIVWLLIEGFHLISAIPAMRNDYAGLDLTIIKRSYNFPNYKHNYLPFDAGMILGILLLVISILLVIATIYDVLTYTPEYKQDFLDIKDFLKKLFKNIKVLFKKLLKNIKAFFAKIFRKKREVNKNG